MKIPPFQLERYLAKHEFSAPHILCASDCESMSLKDLLDFEPPARAQFEQLWLGYTESLGGPELREAIGRGYESISKDEVLVHAGAEEAIFTFMNVALKPGDHVIVHYPCYQSLFQIAQTIGCEVTRWQGDPAQGWALDVNFLKAHLRPNTRAVVLNSPHNPTGYLMERDKLKEVVALLERHGALLFMDEVYRGLEYDPETTLPSACDIYENAFSLGVTSKALGLAGLRIGWIATHRRDLYDEIAKFKDYTTICSSGPSEFLATLALNHRARVMKRNRELIRENLRLLKEFMKRHGAQFSWTEPRAGCITFLGLRNHDADSLCQNLLTKAGVLLAPGSTFGAEGEYVRVGFGRKTFAEGLARLEHFLKA